MNTIIVKIVEYSLNSDKTVPYILANVKCCSQLDTRSIAKTHIKSCLHYRHFKHDQNLSHTLDLELNQISIRDYHRFRNLEDISEHFIRYQSLTSLSSAVVFCKT